MFRSPWNLTGGSAVILPSRLSNFIAIEKLWTYISRLQDFARSGGKMSVTYWISVLWSHLPYTCPLWDPLPNTKDAHTPCHTISRVCYPCGTHSLDWQPGDMIYYAAATAWVIKHLTSLANLLVHHLIVWMHVKKTPISSALPDWFRFDWSPKLLSYQTNLCKRVNTAITKIYEASRWSSRFWRQKQTRPLATKLNRLLLECDLDDIACHTYRVVNNYNTESVLERWGDRQTDCISGFAFSRGWRCM